MSPTSYRTALPRVIRPKRFAPTAKIIIARFAAPVNPCGENFPIHYKGRGRQRALYGPRRSFPLPHHKVAAPRPQNRPDKKTASRSFPRPRPHHKVAASRPPSAEKARDRKTVQTKNQHRGRSPGPAHIAKSRHRARRAPKKPATAKPSRQKISIAVVPPAPPTSQSRGIRARRAPKGPQNRPDAKPASSPPAPHFARKRRGHPAAAAPSFAGDQALILRMAVAVTCVGAALVPASALS